MKLKNKKTGEIVIANVSRVVSGVDFDCGQTLAELNEEWEDYEEPKECKYWYIDVDDDDVYQTDDKKWLNDRNRELIGNYFKTREEAMKALEKLKAWKRLKDKGFKVDLWDYDGSDGQGRIRTGRILFRVKDYEENDKDLDLLFGGEE